MATIAQEKPWLSVERKADVTCIKAGGPWHVMSLHWAYEEVEKAGSPNTGSVELDLQAVDKMDTAGALLFFDMISMCDRSGVNVSFSGISDEQRLLLKQVEENYEPCAIEPPRKNSLIKQVEEIGVATVTIVEGFGALLTFLGLVLMRLLRTIMQPRRLRLTALVFQMEHVGLKAIPIVGLISFLIGAVIVNQGAIQLQKFGADVYVIDMLAFSQLRELGILLTAIIVAGRSGSAFTAQIGSMKLREEVDAMEVIGLDPVETLVLPRLIALILILPILTFYADLMGLLGGGLMAWGTLDISPGTFLARLREAADFSTFAVGMIKAPFFAIVIAITGCFEGLNVSGSAESVGLHTTNSVVHSIFLVIVLNAFFAIFFTTVGL